MSEVCGAPHPYLAGVSCSIPKGQHASHIPDGYVRWDASSPQPWNNDQFIMPSSVGSKEESDRTVVGIAQMLGSEFAHAHRNDPQTSHDVAEALGDLSETMALVLRVIATYGPLTQDTVHAIACEERGEDWNMKAHSSYRSMVSVLQKRGLVRDSGVRGLSDLGNPAVKYEATEEGARIVGEAG